MSPFPDKGRSRAVVAKMYRLMWCSTQFTENVIQPLPVESQVFSHGSLFLKGNLLINCYKVANNC